MAGLDEGMGGWVEGRVDGPGAGVHTFHLSTGEAESGEFQARRCYIVRLMGE